MRAFFFFFFFQFCYDTQSATDILPAGLKLGVNMMWAECGWQLLCERRCVCKNENSKGGKKKTFYYYWWLLWSLSVLFIKKVIRYLIIPVSLALTTSVNTGALRCFTPFMFPLRLRARGFELPSCSTLSTEPRVFFKSSRSNYFQKQKKKLSPCLPLPLQSFLSLHPHQLRLNLHTQSRL